LPNNASLEGDKTYHWRVLAINISTPSANNTIRTFTTRVNPPRNVTLNYPFDNATDVSLTPTFIWQAPSSGSVPEIYRVQLSKTSDFSYIELNEIVEHPITTYTVPNEMALEEETVYFWRIIPANEAGNALPPHITRQFKTIAPYPYPVVLLSPEDDASEIALTPTFLWETGSSYSSRAVPTHYRLDISTDSDFNNIIYTNDTIIHPTNMHTIENESILNNYTVYYWRVIAINNNGESIDNKVWKFMTVIAPPLPVTNLIYPENEEIIISLNPILQWENPTNTPEREGLYVYLSTSNPPFDPDDLENNKIATLEADIDSWQVYPDLLYETTYYWQIVPFNSAGLAEENAIGTFNTLPAIPLPVALISPADGETNISIFPTLSWEESTSTISGYYLYLGESPDLFNHEEPERNRIAILPADITEWTPTDALEYLETYYWTVVAYNSTGAGTTDLIWSFTTEDITNIYDETGLPIITRLRGNFPNPFNPETVISFQVSSSYSQTHNIRLDIYNARGQLIRSLINGNVTPGVHYVTWNGRDDFGNQVGSGIYFYRLIAGDTTETRRMLLMK
jgi:hypothetical protein